MSYDLMVFDPNVAPRDRDAFMQWYEAQTEWAEDHSYNDPSVTSAGLADWYTAITVEFPPMNGPNRSDDVDSAKVTDYSVGHSVIYAAFAWSQAQRAHMVVRQLAAEKGVGFFDVSAEKGEILFPEDAAAQDG